MSGPSYQVWLRDIASDALYLDLTDYLIQLEWTRVASEVGAFSCVLPESFPKTYLDLDSHLDWRVEIWRRADEASPLKLENIGLIRRVTTQTDEEGITNHVISGPDIMHLLTRRNSVEQEKVGAGHTSRYAADMMRTIVREEFINSTDFSTDPFGSPSYHAHYDRALPTNCGWTFGCEADTNTGDIWPNGTSWVSFECSAKNVMDSLKELYSWSREPGKGRQYLYFHIDFDDYKTWTFRIHPNRIGVDHSRDSGQAVLIGLDYGNLSIPVLDWDRTDEWTVAIHREVEGTEQTYSKWYVAADNTRGGHSVINFIEKTETVAYYQRHPSDLLAEGRRKQIFTGKLINGPGDCYGREYGFGDELSISYNGRQYDTDLIGVSATLDNTGHEEMRVMLDIPPI